MIEDLKRLATEAGREILKIYTLADADWNVTRKTDDSPLTRADLRANEIIMAGLRVISSDLIISEEDHASLANVPARFWLVDPLDGTRDFINRQDTFCVCIALIENGHPIKGVIHSPVTDELWWAERGQGAWASRPPPARSNPAGGTPADANQPGTPADANHPGPAAGESSPGDPNRHAPASAAPGGPTPDGLADGATADGVRTVEQIHNRRTERTKLVAAGSRSIPSHRMNLLYEKFDIARVERFGSALKFVRMAEGLYDVYPRFGPMMEWDTAAGQIIAEEAGCKVIDINTLKPLRYGKPGLENKGFLAARADLDLESRLVLLT